MKNRKGFTLSEILVVIAIIGIIFLIAIPSIIAINKSIKKRELETKKEALITAAELYAKNNVSEFGGGDILRIPVRTLLYYGYITKEADCSEPIGCIINPVDDSSMNDEIITIKRNMAITQAEWGKEYGTAMCATFDWNDGSGMSESRCCSEAYKKCDIITPVITRNGFEILGWNTSSTATEGKIEENTKITITGSITYYEITKKNVTVTFNPNGGSITSGSSTSNCSIYNTSTSCAVTAPTCTRDNYTRSSWNTASDGTGSTVALSTVTNSLTAYAIWDANVYRVTLDKQSGTGGTTYIYEKYNTGWYSDSAGSTPVTSITTPTRSGYAFGGYFTSENGEGTQIINDSGTILSGKTTTFSSIGRLYAKWTINSYTVAYNKNASDATGTTASSSHTYNVAKNLTKNGYSRDGYKFVGWNTESDGSGTSYTDEQSVTNLTTTSGSTVTLYAIWESYKLSIIYNGNGQTSFSSTSTTHNFTVDSNGNVLDNGTKYIVKFNYNTIISPTTGGLPDYNGKFFNFVKTGHSAVSGKQWCVKSSGSKTCYDQTSTTINTNDVASSGGCDLSKRDCEVTAYINWEPAIYTITLNKSGGDGGPDEIYVKYNTGWYLDSNASTPLTTVVKPTRSNYTFNGYFYNGTQIIESNGSIKSGYTTLFTSDNTLVAGWTQNDDPYDNPFAGCSCKGTPEIRVTCGTNNDWSGKYNEYGLLCVTKNGVTKCCQ